MDLKTFVAEALVQIQEGVQEAIERRTETPRSSGVINPVWGDHADIGHNHVQKVSFDVAVIATDKNSSEAGSSISVVSGDWKTDTGKISTEDQTKASETSQASRVKFDIPFIPPVQIVRG